MDTSALLHAWKRDYPPDTFPTVWSKFDQLLDAERLIAPHEVLLELERGDDEACAWVRARPQLAIQPDEEVQARLAEIVNRWPEFLPPDSHDGIWADPYVIALAASRSATVVTGESFAPANASRPKIPNICQELHVEYVTVLGLLRREAWTF